MSARSWEAENQGWLVAAVGRVRALLARAADPEAAEPQDPPEWTMERPPALESLAEALGLSPFEHDVLVMCAGMELDGSFPATVLAASGTPRPTFSVALAAFPEPHWTALAPDAPLRHWRLIELGAGDGLTSSPLRIDERILHFLAGVAAPDERLAGIVEPVRGEGALPPSHAAAAERLAALWSAPAALPPLPFLCGDERSGKRTVTAAAAGALGLTVFRARATDLPAAAAERETLVRLWERESLLSAAVLLLEVEDGDGPEAQRAAVALAERVRAPLAVSAREPLATDTRPAVRIAVDRPPADEQRTLWRAALGEDAAALNGALDGLTAQFHLGVREIAQAAAEARPGPGEELAARLWTACRAQARPRLDELAQHIPPAAGWDELVLPEAQARTLRDITAQVRQRARVYEEWGFARRGARGMGVSALFAGPSGTGKTLAAEVLAGALELDLYRIDLSQVVSKYIGETEKNLARVFDAAEEGGAVLLFDEADALFGKRSAVKDAHDRYANIEVSYLLQRMETYRGLAILTTNLKDSVDTAFLRRLRFVVTFPFPDAPQRADIWRRAFPPATPTAGLDPDKLARLSVTGGNIRNIALGAAFLAAEEDGPVRMEHLLRAARAELAKLEKPVSAAEVAGWA
ncbi:MAG TPA: ATP-binding protein [Longimicrobium sp.]|nr:ATP-binding protein [Longimicrobium sp.]